MSWPRFIAVPMVTIAMFFATSWINNFFFEKSFWLFYQLNQVEIDYLWEKADRRGIHGIRNSWLFDGYTKIRGFDNQEINDPTVREAVQSLGIQSAGFEKQYMKLGFGTRGSYGFYLFKEYVSQIDLYEFKGCYRDWWSVADKVYAYRYNN